MMKLDIYHFAYCPRALKGEPKFIKKFPPLSRSDAALIVPRMKEEGNYLTEFEWRVVLEVQ
jgi:ABC-type sulfate transport system substrate-binding protein